MADLQEVVGRFQTAAGALAALCAVLDGSKSSPLTPYLANVVRALELDPDEVAAHPDRVAIAAEIRTLMHANLKLASDPGAAGWSPREESLMQAAGDATASRLARKMFPKIDDGGLADRLAAEGAAFLDVGVGVAALSIEMARVWPNLRVVGIDTWAPSLALARKNVQAAGLEDRIELRECPGERLNDERAFDLAWVPSLFVPGNVLPELLRRVRRSLKEGGWLILPMLKAQSTDPLALTITRLRTAFWNGSLLTIEHDADPMLRASGFGEVKKLPSTDAATTGMIAAR